MNENLTNLYLAHLTAGSPSKLYDGHICTDVNSSNKREYIHLKNTIYLDQDDFIKNAAETFPNTQKLEPRVFIMSSEIKHESLRLISRKNFKGQCTRFLDLILVNEALCNMTNN
jgi:NADPH-dependent 7-cyano-7-deazaguanine reductase QueF-like protein